MESIRTAWPCRTVGLRLVLIVVAVVVGSGLALAAGLPGAEAESKDYSAYSDPQKPVLSFLLADDSNARAFQQEFGLDDGEIKEVRAAVRRETTTFSKEYDESEQIVESHRGATPEEIGAKISRSDFDEKVEAAVGRAKADVEDLLPEGRADDLGPWVDERWREEAAEFTAQSEASYEATATGHTCKVWATYYRGVSRYEVALPHQKVKFSGGRKVRINPVSGGQRIHAPVKDTGPWNTRDNYWRSSKHRSMWRNLPRCVPEAQAAYFDNYHRGKDQFGREVGNPAGMDVTPAVARRMGMWKRIQTRGYIRVRVHYPWVKG